MNRFYRREESKIMHISLNAHSILISSTNIMWTIHTIPTYSVYQLYDKCKRNSHCLLLQIQMSEQKLEERGEQFECTFHTDIILSLTKHQNIIASFICNNYGLTILFFYGCMPIEYYLHLSIVMSLLWLVGLACSAWEL